MNTGIYKNIHKWAWYPVAGCTFPYLILKTYVLNICSAKHVNNHYTMQMLHWTKTDLIFSWRCSWWRWRSVAGLWWWSSFRLSGWPTQGGGEQASCGRLSQQDEEQAHYLLPAEAECRRRSSGCQVPCGTARPGLGALQTTERYYGASLITSTKEKCPGTISMKGLLFNCFNFSRCRACSEASWQGD